MPATRPPAVSTTRSGPCISRPRSLAATVPVTVWAALPPTSAPTMLASGSQVDCDPPFRRCGAIRAPASAPSANPARPSTFATRPRRAPSTADTTTHATTIRSTPPTPRVIPFRRRRGPAGDVPDCRGGLRTTRGRPGSAQPADGGRIQGLERRGRRCESGRGLSALGDRRRAVRGDRLGALHRLPADAPDRPHGGRRRAPGRVARDRGLRICRARSPDRPRHRAEHALALVLGRDRRARAHVPVASS